MAGIHEGHRDRLRSKIKRFGIGCLEDHEKLEYLLYPFVPRRDTNPIAHELIAAFGSFKDVLDADVETLASVKGMTENAALFLHGLPEVFSAYVISDRGQKMSSRRACADRVIAQIGRNKEERFIVLYMGENGKLIKTENSTSERKRFVQVNRDHLVAAAVQCRADYVFIGHNHPNGDLNPSQADVDSSNRILQALAMVGIKLVDSVIVFDQESFSMRDNGLLADPVNLNGSLSEFAQGLIRRENDIGKIRHIRQDEEF